ncbi:hypothetical protein BDW02DRAFT_575184 [Decorospora gaudefroyi]|uniref:Uncharacterized protein n=1 Tax=Decorospora gaudefroyi TaxID=184978 RepID=A0A6A5JW91_9PLEO|nr:hypothetical protein BDW02DRAFT_575184 [Decorospora gaudefroyi]
MSAYNTSPKSNQRVEIQSLRTALNTSRNDVHQLQTAVQRLCHNPREQQEAIQRFASVRQKDDKSLLAYLARFKRLSHKAGARSSQSSSVASARHQHRTNHDLCYCCGSNQHWIKDCSQARPKLLLNQPSQPLQKKLTTCRTGSPHLRHSP